MSAFSTVVDAVERVTRIRRRYATKVKADCPLCERRGRLEIEQQPSGRVVFICHAGCDREALRERLGLDWQDFFEDVPYLPAPRRSAAQHVLHAITGMRWTITEHDFAGDADLALAVEIVERLLPARHAVRSLLRLKVGTPIAWNEFPLTVSFAMELGTKLLGRAVGEHRARRLIHLLIDQGLIEHIGTLSVDGKDGPKFLPIFKLDPRTTRTWEKKVRLAQEAAVLLGSDGPSPAPATVTVLSAGDHLSTLGNKLGGQLRAARDRHGALGRSSPALHLAERER